MSESESENKQEESEREREPERGEQRSSVGEEPPIDPDRHWEGYPGEEAAAAYPVVDRGRYTLLLVLMLVAFLFVGLVVMIHGYHREGPARRPSGGLVMDVVPPSPKG